MFFVCLDELRHLRDPKEMSRVVISSLVCVYGANFSSDKFSTYFFGLQREENFSPKAVSSGHEKGVKLWTLLEGWTLIDLQTSWKKLFDRKMKDIIWPEFSALFKIRFAVSALWSVPHCYERLCRTYVTSIFTYTVSPLVIQGKISPSAGFRVFTKSTTCIM